MVSQALRMAKFEPTNENLWDSLLFLFKIEENAKATRNVEGCQQKFEDIEFQATMP